MLSMADFYYKKYELIEDWDKDSQDSYGSRKIYGSEVTTESLSDGGQYISSSGGYTDFQKVETNVNGFNDYELEPTNFQEFPLGTDQRVFADAAEYTNYEPGEAIAEGYITYKDSFTTYWQIEKIHYLSNEYTIYKHYSPGELLAEDVILDDSYPKNGPKDGYWWIRGKEYTIPPPKLISPANGLIINAKEGDTIPYFVFELQPREDNDPYDYHIRARFGTTSDMRGQNNPLINYESKNNQSNWEYYDGSTWQAFPGGGVSAGTKVRCQPPIDAFDFGFFYWDATAHNPNWQYGIISPFRLFIFVDETDEVYKLMIGDIEYKALGLDIKEASNGTVGKININLNNHKI